MISPDRGIIRISAAFAGILVRLEIRTVQVYRSLSAGEKAEAFQKAENGEIDVMIGPRSALFTPFPKLGMILIDEEHEDERQDHGEDIAYRGDIDAE